MSGEAPPSLSDVLEPLQRIVEFVDMVSPWVPEAFALCRRYRDDGEYRAEFDAALASSPRDAFGCPEWPADFEQ
ncbi:MAG: hypothetical protein ACYTFA_18275, partial [Planctomycetota bacterium]